MGKMLFLSGLALSALGLVLWWRADALSWFGHLPGDIRVERESFHFYMPLSSLLILSLAVNLILRLVQKL